MKIEMEPIGWVESTRTQPDPDMWGGGESCIVLSERFQAEALDGIEAFSHVEILFCFDRIDRSAVTTGTRHPRGNPAWPVVGIFVQRGSRRPNRIGATICRIVGRDGRRLFVAELDAIDGTPVLDIKPVMVEFLPRAPVAQPDWSHELMRQYWNTPGRPDTA